MIYLVEYYVKGPNGETGWNIRFAWVVNCPSDAKCRAVVANLPDFDTIILVTEHASIFSLALENPVVTYVNFADWTEDTTSTNWYLFVDQAELNRRRSTRVAYVEPANRPRN